MIKSRSLIGKALYVFQVGGTWRPRNKLIYKGHIGALRATNLESIKSHRKLMTDSSADVCRALIAAADQLIAEVPADHPRHGNVVIDFGTSMAHVWKVTRDEAVWQHGLDLILNWLEQTADDWRHTVYVLAHGLMLFERAQTTFEGSDISDAIAVLERAFESVRQGSFVVRKSELPLAYLFLTRYKQTEDIADLEAALAYSWQKISTGHKTDPDRFYALKTFVQSLLEHYTLKNEMDDLEAAITFASDAIDISPTLYDRGDMEMFLGTALRHLYARSQSEEALERAIQAHQASLEHSDPENVELVVGRTDNLTNALADRYAHNKARTDIDRAVELKLAALDRLPRQSPLRIRMLRNLGVALINLGSARSDEYVLQSSLTTFRAGLSLARENRDEDEEILLLRFIANLLLVLDMRQGTHDRLNKAIVALEQAHEKSWARDKIATEVTFRLAERETTIQIVRLLTGALLCRAGLGGNRAEQDLTRAFVIGEASKSTLLIREVMRRSLSAPPSIPRDMIDKEGMWLARLAGLDFIHLRADPKTSLARKRRQLEERSHLIRALEEVWDEIEATGPEGRAYVNLRRSPHAAFVQLLAKPRGETACLSMLETEFPVAVGKNQRQLAIMALWPSALVPQLLSWLPNDPLSEVSAQMAAQIQEYRAADAWFESIVTPLSADIPQALGRVTVSATHAGQNIPWHVIIEKAGWLSPEKAALPVILVPGLAMMLFDEEAMPSASRWHSAIDHWRSSKIRARTGVKELDDWDAIQVLQRMGKRASGAPLVVGNPGADLPDAEREATSVGNILKARPLVGESAIVAAVRDALGSANLVHLATHAMFHPTSPLDSQVKLADGDLSVRDLLGVWSTARLVVLSARESASGEPLAGGELSGLATAFLLAGVRSVVASLWRVDDAATRFLMTGFYRALQTELDVPEALASAMQLVRQQPGWDDPYYWAGFVTFQRGMAD